MDTGVQVGAEIEGGVKGRDTIVRDMTLVLVGEKTETNTGVRRGAVVDTGGIAGTGVVGTWVNAGRGVEVTKGVPPGAGVAVPVGFCHKAKTVEAMEDAVSTIFGDFSAINPMNSETIKKTNRANIILVARKIHWILWS
jgi:hypothetical protein